MLFCCISSQAQDSTQHNHNNNNRKWLVGGLSVAGYSGSLVALNAAWYNQYEKTRFHTFNDAGEWLQVDKVGHAWTAYNLSRASSAAWRWAGLQPKAAVWIGSGSGFAYLTVIEILDARSARWGWSWPDMGANLFGAALFASQEMLWEQQRIQFKFSAHKTSYGVSLQPRATELYGNTLAERLLKDYNTQTYWLSMNLHSFFPRSSLPAWLNVSVGYGAEGLFGGYENKVVDKDGVVVFDRRDLKRYRQWYLAPDIDLSRIKTKNKLLKTGLSIFNAVKIPAPALEYANGRLKLKAIAF